MKKYSIYVTYLLENIITDLSNYPDVGYGNTTPIHCNYIQRIDVDSYDSSDEVNLYFTDPEDFKFLNVVDESENLSGLGFSVNKVSMLIQVVNNIETNEQGVYKLKTPISSQWRKLDVTDNLFVYDGEDIIPHTVGQQIKPESFEVSSFKFSLSLYGSAELYDLSYLNYPNQTDFDNLCFGDEELFFGNVKTGIQATIHTTDLNITLGVDEFNSTTNETWDGESDIWVSEVGIYDNDNNLVAIGKLNNPIRKNSNTLRTINFAIDF